MRLSSLADLLAGKLSAPAFSAEIAEEIRVHTRDLQMLGGSAHVVVSEDTDVLLDRAGLSTLCRLFASGQITAAELAYAADVLQMSERVVFTESSVADDLAPGVRVVAARQLRCGRPRSCATRHAGRCLTSQEDVDELV